MLQSVVSMLDEFNPEASTEGCSPNTLLQFAKHYGYGLVCLHNNRPTVTHPCAPILAFNIVDSHCYMHNSSIVFTLIVKSFNGSNGMERGGRMYHLSIPL